MSLTSLNDIGIGTVTTLTSFIYEMEIDKVTKAAFNKNQHIGYISIPNAKDIEADAFAQCSQLSTLILPGIDYDDKQIFSTDIATKPPRLQTIEVGYGTTKIGTAFQNLTALTNISLPRSIETFEANSLAGCTQITELDLRGINLTEDCFKEMNNLRSLHFSYVSDTPNIGLAELTALEKIYVEVPEPLTLGTYFKNTRITTLEFSDDGKNITSMVDGCFSDMAQLQTIDIQNATLTTIPQNAFKNVNNVIFKLPTSTITEIKHNAFEGCNNTVFSEFPNLTAIEYVGAPLTLNSYPTNLKRIAENGLKDLTLTTDSTVTLSNPNMSIDSHAFEKCNLQTLTLKNGPITSIPEYMCYGCSQLKKVELDDAVAEIGQYAFSSCKMLSEINLDYVRQIDEQAFSQSNLNGVISLPENIKVKDKAFEVVGIIEMTLPSSFVTDNSAFGNNIFNGCTSMSKLTIPATSKTLDEKWKSRCGGQSLVITDPTDTATISKVWSALCTLFGIKSDLIIVLNDVVLTQSGSGNEYKCLKYNETKDTLTKIDSTESDFSIFIAKPSLPTYTWNIGENAAKDVSELTSIIFDNALTSIGNNAFENTKLVNLDLKNVKTVGTAAFKSSTALQKIKLTESVHSLGNSAFADCLNVTEIEFAANSDLSCLSENVFNGCFEVTALTIPGYIRELKTNSLNGLSEQLSVTLRYRSSDDAIILLNNNQPKAPNKTSFFCTDNGYQYPSFIVDGADLIRIQHRAFNVNTDFTLLSVDDSLLGYGTLDYSRFEHIQKIASNAFSSVTRISQVNLPPTLLDNCERDAFAGMSSLKILRVNTNYSSDKYSGIIEHLGCKDAIVRFDNGKAYWNQSEQQIFVLDTSFYDYDYIGTERRILSTFNDRITETSHDTEGCTIIGTEAFRTTPILEHLDASIVTQIQDKGFFGNQVLKDITFSNSLTAIGRDAFAQVNLSSLSIPGSILSVEGYGISSAYQLKKLSFGEGVKQINNGAFQNMRANLSSLDFPTTLTSIGEFAFAEVDHEFPRIENANFENATGLKVIGDCAFYNSICTLKDRTLKTPYSLLSIGDYAFAYSDEAYTQKLSALDTTDKEASFTNVQHIGNGAFIRHRFKKITLNEGLKWIGDYAFAYPRYKYSITIPSTLEHIGANAFAGSIVQNPEKVSANLIYINKPVSDFPAMFGTEEPDDMYTTDNVPAFAEHMCLSSITDDQDPLQSTVYVYGNRMHYVPEYLSIDVLVKSVVKCEHAADKALIQPYLKKIDHNAFEDCNQLTSLSVFTNELQISNAAFKNCTHLESIACQNEHFYVKDVESETFYGDEDLNNVKLLSTTSHIGDLAFYNCRSLTSLQDFIPSYELENCELTSIGSSALMSCTSLTSFDIYPTLKEIGDEPFSYCTSLGSIRIYMNDTDFVAMYNNSHGTTYNTEVVIKTLFNNVRPDFKCEIQFNNSSYMNNGIVKIDNEYVKLYPASSGLSSVSAFLYYKAEEDNKTYLNLSAIDTIDQFTFSEAKLLNSFNVVKSPIGSSLQNIGEYAFSHCENLEYFCENSLQCKKIGNYAFADCKKLIQMEIDVDYLQEAGYGAFYNTSLSVLEFKTSKDTLNEALDTIKEKIHWNENDRNPLELPQYTKVIVWLKGMTEFGRYDYLLQDLNHCSIDTNKNQLVFMDKTSKSIMPLLVVPNQKTSELPALLKNNFHVNIIGRWK